jgi:hypothetical protein
MQQDTYNMLYLPAEEDAYPGDKEKETIEQIIKSFNAIDKKKDNRDDKKRCRNHFTTSQGQS